MAYDDLTGLFPWDTADAQSRAQALADALKRQQAVGLVAQMFGDKQIAGAGEGLQQGAQHGLDQAYQTYRVLPQLQEHADLMSARKNPQYGAGLLNAIQRFRGGADVSDLTGAPVQVLERLLPVEEKYGQSYMALGARAALHGLQDKVDPVTKEPYRFDPISGATFHTDGSPRTPAIRGFPTFGGGAPGTPAAPGSAPAAPKAPRGGPAAPALPTQVAAPPAAPQPLGPQLPGEAFPDVPPPAAPTPGAPLRNLPERTRDPRAAKWATELKTDLDAAKASSRSTFGSASNVIFRGARVLPLLLQKNPDGTPRQPTTQEWQDISAALVAMQTNGVPPEQMTLNAMPRDIAGNASTMMSWLMSKPYAPDRQEWVARFVDNIKREEEAAKKQIRTSQLQRVGTHSDYALTFPNRMKQDLRSYGLDPGLVDQIRSGTYAAPADAETGGAPVAGTAAQPSPEDLAAKQWLEANPNDPRAEKVRAKLKAKGL